MTAASAISRDRSHSLVIPIVFALALQALGGLLLPWLYRDSPWVTTAMRGSDITNLAVVIPLLIWLRALVRRASVRAQLALVGVLFYVWENNLYYLAGCAFNQLFLLYVAISVLSLVDLVLTLVGIDRAQLDRQAAARMPRKTISVIAAAMAGTLGVLWVGQCVASLVTGQTPQILVDAGGSTHLVAALDLSLLAPLYLLGAALLWRAQVWGHIIAAATLVQGALVTIGLTITAPVQSAAGIEGAWTMAPLWGLMGVCFLVGAVLLLKNTASR